MRPIPVSLVSTISAPGTGASRARWKRRACAGVVTFICHELTEFTRRLLVAGTVDAVIDQNPRVEARDAVEWLVHAAHGRPAPTLPPIRIQAIFKENIPQV